MCTLRQGVLMLNNVLTVRRGEANSHKDQGWEKFTDAVVAALNKRSGEGLVFMLWGKPAQKKGQGINRTRHTVRWRAHMCQFVRT